MLLFGSSLELNCCLRLSNRLDEARPEVDLLRHGLSVFIREVPVNFADQDSSVLVADPCCDRHEVQARHNAHTYEVMTTVVEVEAGYLGRLPDHGQGLPERLGRNVLLPSLR